MEVVQTKDLFIDYRVVYIENINNEWSKLINKHFCMKMKYKDSGSYIQTKTLLLAPN